MTDATSENPPDAGVGYFEFKLSHSTETGADAVRLFVLDDLGGRAEIGLTATLLRTLARRAVALADLVAPNDPGMPYTYTYGSVAMTAQSIRNTPPVPVEADEFRDKLIDKLETELANIDGETPTMTALVVEDDATRPAHGTTEDGYVCPHCPREFDTMRGLSTHEAMCAENPKYATPVKPAEHLCSEPGCGRTFASGHGLTVHMALVQHGPYGESSLRDLVYSGAATKAKPTNTTPVGSKSDPLSYECPTCHSEPGSKCRRGGDPMDWPHPSRRTLAGEK